jgi:GTP-binding protein SAR1
MLGLPSSGLPGLGLVPLVDASAPERFAEAKKELDALMRIEEIEGVPVLVLKNKTDKSGAVEREVLGKLWS